MTFKYPAHPVVWKSLVNQKGRVDFAEMTEEGKIFVNITLNGNVYNHLLLQCTNDAKDPKRLDVLIPNPDNKGQFLRIWFDKYMLDQALSRSLNKLV